MKFHQNRLNYFPTAKRLTERWTLPSLTYYCYYYYYYYYYYYCSIALSWALAAFFSFFILYTVRRTIPWTGDQPVARPLPTHRTTQTQNKRTQCIHTLNVIRTHDPSVGHCDRLLPSTHSVNMRREKNEHSEREQGEQNQKERNGQFIQKRSCVYVLWNTVYYPILPFLLSSCSCSRHVFHPSILSLYSRHTTTNSIGEMTCNWYQIRPWDGNPIIRQ
jgi:hypothetical protein